MSKASDVVSFAYSHGEIGEYSRPTEKELREFGGRCLASSNDGASVLSFSPIEEWEFDDGSMVSVGYSSADEVEGAKQPTSAGFSFNAHTA